MRGLGVSKASLSGCQWVRRRPCGPNSAGTTAQEEDGDAPEAQRRCRQGEAAEA
jgi:hypothetical protein